MKTLPLALLILSCALIAPARMVLAKGETHMTIITAAWKAKTAGAISPGKKFHCDFGAQSPLQNFLA